jgi:hypothetical protein
MVSSGSGDGQASQSGAAPAVTPAPQPQVEPTASPIWRRQSPTYRQAGGEMEARLPVDEVCRDLGFSRMSWNGR